MKIIPRLTITKNHRVGDETPIKTPTEMSFDNSDDKFFLRVDGKPTHRFLQCENYNPQKLDDLDSKVIILMPLQPWCALCSNNNAYEKNSGMLKMADEEMVPSALAIHSDPYHDAGAIPEIFEKMIEKINSHMKSTLDIIEKNNDRGR